MPLLTLPIVHSRDLPPRNRVIRLDLSGEPFPFQAGQYVLLGQHGGGERRPYSIASAPSEATRHGLLEFLIQVDDRGSPGPHLPSLDVGCLLDVEGPAGGFVLPGPPRPAHVLFVCGGTGIAPVRSMLHELLRTDPSVRIGLLQSGRTPEDLAYGEELRELARCGRIRLAQTVTRDAPGSWTGARGRIGAARLHEAMTGPRPECFVCGPDSLVADVPRLLADLRIPPEQVHTEHWADR